MEAKGALEALMNGVIPKEVWETGTNETVLRR